MKNERISSNEFKYFIEVVKSKKWNKIEKLFVSHDNEIVVVNKIFGTNYGLVSYRGTERQLTFIQNLITIYNIIFSKIIFNKPVLNKDILFKNMVINFNKL